MAIFYVLGYDIYSILAKVMLDIFQLNLFELDK